MASCFLRDDLRKDWVMLKALEKHSQMAVLKRRKLTRLQDTTKRR